ncbi:MAG: glycoside hydrolase family 125 protein [Candidatus Izemoplasmatales bacterium]
MKRHLSMVAILALATILLGCRETTTVTTVDPAPYEIENGGFETGDLTGWTIVSGTAFTASGVTDDDATAAAVPYGKEGAYLYGREDETAVGVLSSAPFTIGGAGILTFRLGAGANPGLTYVSIVDDETGVERFRFGNALYHETAYATDPSGYRVDNLVPYCADLSAMMGETVRILLVDRSTENRGYLTFDAFETYYPVAPDLSGMTLAEDVKPVFADAAGTPNVLYNADFATGSLSGWTAVGEDGAFRASHLNANDRLSNRPDETRVGLLRSSAFKVGGTGLISFRLGATKHSDLTYLSILKVGTNEEVFRTYSDRWKEADEENTHLYYVDLYDHLGECLYVELVDNARGDWGLVTFEDLATFYAAYPSMTDEVAVNLLEPFDTTPDYAEMRATVDGLIAGIEDETERLTFQKTFYATLDGVQNRVGTFPSVTEVDPDGTVFIRTGDIDAMWLRDSSAQVLAYLRFMNLDSDVKQLVEGLLKRQFELIRRDPYANAFNPDGSAFERKFEVDSLTYPFWLASQYYEITEDDGVFDAFFQIALDRAITTLEHEQNHSDADYRITNGYDQGAGQNAFAVGTGLVWSAYRPSDDVTHYRYNIPQNMFAAATMAKMAALLEALGKAPALAARASALSASIRQGIETYGVYDHPTLGRIWVFETDGENADPSSSAHKLLTDMANIPSLLSAPWLGYCGADDPTYLGTRAFILSSENPYYYEGTYASGIGDPHDGVGSGGNPHPDVPVPWHMAIAMQGLTALDPEEARRCIDWMTATTAGTYVMHEAFNANDPTQYSRDYFTWPCALYAHLYLTAILEAEPAS